jgi:crossover junction endodeoxyribonuclease RusA
MTNKEKKVKAQKVAIQETAKQNNDLYRVMPERPHATLNMVLPLAPSVNHAYKIVRGRKVMSAQAKQYIALVHKVVTEIKAKECYIPEKENVWLVCEITYYFPDRRQRDSHNMIKILMDALEGVAFVNDRCVMIQEQDVLYDKHNPRLEILLRTHKYNVEQLVK